MTRTFSFQFENLNIKAADLEKHIGYQPFMSLEMFGQLYDEVLEIANSNADIKGGFRIIEKVSVNSWKKNLVIDGVHFKPGRIVINQLKGIMGAAVFVCTAGKPISEISRKFMRDKDLLKGYVFDVVGSIMVERALDQLELILEAELNVADFGITRRVSPGHCGWNIKEQQKLFSLLPEEFCGVSLSESSMMIPSKSISGIVGFGKRIRKKELPCKRCDITECLYRKGSDSLLASGNK